MTDKSEYKNRKKKGVCVRCGKKDPRTENGLTHCLLCAKKESLYASRYAKTPMGKKKAQKASKNYYEKRKNLGLCVRCGSPVEESRKGKIWCSACMEKRSDEHHLTEADRAMGKLLELVCYNGKVLNNG